MSHKFIDPSTIEKAEKRVDRILASFPDSGIQRFQLEEMVYAIEIDAAEHVRYCGDTIVCDGWNSYRNCDCDPTSDPYRAYGGFYRMDNDMAGHAMRMIAEAYHDGKSTEEIRNVAARCNRIYNLNLYWEPAPSIWGYKSSCDMMTEAGAQLILRLERERTGFRRGSVEYLEWSGCYRVKWEGSRKPEPREGQHVHRTRIVS